MAKHRREAGHTPNGRLLQESSLKSKSTPNTINRGKHRAPRVEPPVRKKVVAAMIATGAVGAVGQPFAANADSEEFEPPPSAEHRNELRTAVNGDTRTPAAVDLLSATTATPDELPKLTKSEAIERDRAERAEAQSQAQTAADREARSEQQPQRAADQNRTEPSAEGYAKPAEGTFTSGFGSRWGTVHNGIDIANSVGTPIYTVAAGEVIDAGTASGFGLWVRVQHDDGTITVYGHVNTIEVSEGQRVETGQQIATMGERGESTGPHLHFEVIVDGEKIDPLPWLVDRGISVE